jgi:uncharacterized repeat protein (TIGR01451 family)
MIDQRQAILLSPGLGGPAESVGSGAGQLTRPVLIKQYSNGDGQIVYGLVARVAMSQPGFGFRVEHDLPVGVELVEVRPKAKVVGDHLIWQFGRVDPGQEVRLEIVIRPLPETVIQPEELAVFTATYSHNLYFQVPVVRPRLTARLTGATSAAVGDEVEIIVEVANIGSWQAANVRATVFVPSGFAHRSGSEFVVNVGTLKAGELQRIPVPMVAITRGKSIVRAEISGPDDRRAVIELPIDVN